MVARLRKIRAAPTEEEIVTEEKARQEVLRPSPPVLPSVLPPAIAPEKAELPQPLPIEPAEAPTFEPFEFEDELFNLVQTIYPEKFQEGSFFGRLEDVVPIFAQNLREQAQANVETFLEDLYARGWNDNTERLLEIFGATPEEIEEIFVGAQREARAEDRIQGVYPDMSLEEFAEYIETDWASFIDDMQTGGKTPEKLGLLNKTLGIPFHSDTELDIEDIFAQVKLVVPIDGVRQLVTITADGRTFDQRGNWIANYNFDTREIEPPWSKPTVTIDLELMWGEDLVKTVSSSLGKHYITVTNEDIETYVVDHPEIWDEVEKWSREHPALTLGEELGILWQSLVRLPQNVGASILQATQGSQGASVVDKDWADRFIEDANKSQQQFVKDMTNKYGGRPSLLFISAPDLAAVSQNLAFSVTSMGAGLAVGVPTALLPVPGSRVAAYSLGTAASGYVAYQMSTYQIMQLYLEGKNEEKIKETGAGLTRQEENQLKIEFEDLAHQYGLWEAVPEALSNLAFVSILTAPLAGMLGKSAAMRILTRLTGMYGEELLTETITQKGQSAIEVQAGLREGNISWLEAFKEVAPQTFLLTTIMGGVGGVSISAYNKIKASLKTELGDTHPLYAELEQKITDLFKEIIAEERGAIVPGAEPGRVPELAPIPESPAEVGAEIAEATGLRFDGVQPEIGMQFTDTEVTGTTFYANTLEEARTTLAEKRRLFAIPKAEPGMPEAGVQPSMIPEVPAERFQPPGKGKITQISMDEQLKLEQARQEAQEAPGEVAEAYEVHAEAEGLRVAHEFDPVATYRFKMTGRNVGLDSLISIREQAFPEYLTVKQAQALNSGKAFERYTQKGTAQYNRVPKDAALDQLTKEFDMTPDEIAERVMQIRQEKRRIRDLKDKMTEVMTEKPLAPERELTTTQVKENWENIGQTGLTLKQAKALAGFFGDYVMSQNALDAWELTRELRRETMTQRSESLKSRAQELIVKQGMETEAALNQAIKETLAGELPAEKADYFADVSDDLRSALFTVVYHNKWMQQYPLEMASTVTALTNALQGKPIPRQKGTGSVLFPEGGSAWDRLALVFGPQTRTFKAIEKMATEGKTTRQIVEALYEVTGQDPIPIDEKMADYLRKLKDIPQGYRTLLEPDFENPQVKDLRNPADHQFAVAELELATRFAKGELTFDEFQLERTEARDLAYPSLPLPKFEAPIDDGFGKAPLMNFGERQMLVRTLKQIGWLPVDIGNLLRALKATLDNSFLRQAKVLSAGHPVIAFQAHTTSWQNMFSQKHSEAEWELITRDPDFAIYDEIRVKTGHDPLRIPSFAAVKGTEQYRTAEEFGFPTVERLIPRLTAQLPVVKPFERAFSGGTNKIVWGVWKSKLKFSRRYSEKIASGKITLKEGEAFDIIQEMTDHQAFLANAIQRATLPERARAMAPIFSAFFFAFRSKLARFLIPVHLTGLSYSKARGVTFNPRVMREAWRDFILINAEIGGVLFLGSWLGLWELETDPRNAEFMSIRIGNQRIDPWAGYRQFVVLYARLVTGTGISSVTGAEYDVDPIGAAKSFTINSLSPLASILLEFWTGRNFLGAVIDFADRRYWIEKITPFAIQDVWESFEGEGWKGAAIATLPAWYGEGVQTYTGEWLENFTKLGLPKYSENVGYGITNPKYDVKDFYADHSSEFRGVDPATLTAEKGFPEYIRVLAEVKVIKDTLDDLPNEVLFNINADPDKGLTFQQYYEMWGDRQKLVDAGEDAEFTVSELQPDGKYKTVTYKGEEALAAFDRDERFRDAQLGNFSQRQYALLVEYHSIENKSDQAAFLEQNKDLIGINPRRQHLIDNPEENAKLVIYGQATVYSKDAYDIARRLITELDFPDSAVAEYLPPAHVVDTHFEYLEMGQERGYNSWEIQILLRQNALDAEENKVQSYVDWRNTTDQPLTLSTTPMASLALKTTPKFRGIYDEIDAVKDSESPEYIEDEAERTDHIDGLKDTIIEGDFTYRDYERKIDAIEKGSDENPISDKIVSLYVERGRMIDQEGVGSSSAQVMLQRVDNPAFNAFLMDKDLWGDNALKEIDQTRIPIWRIDVEMNKLDPESDEYKRLNYKKEAYTKEFPEKLIETYVDYYMLPEKPDDWPGNVGYYVDDWFLQDNPEFHQALVDFGRFGELKDLSKVPTREIFEKWWIYNTLTTQFDKDAYRLENPDLDEWGVSVEIWKRTMSEKRRRARITPSERFREDIEKRKAEFRKMLEALGIGLR